MERPAVRLFGIYRLRSGEPQCCERCVYFLQRKDRASRCTTHDVLVRAVETCPQWKATK